MSRSVHGCPSIPHPLGLEGKPHEQGELVALGAGLDGLGHDGADAGGGEDDRVVVVIENLSLDVGEGEAGSGQDGGEIELGHAPSSTAGGGVLRTFSCHVLRLLQPGAPGGGQLALSGCRNRS